MTAGLVRAGDRFDRLVVLERVPVAPGERRASASFWAYRCACDCGGAKVATAYALRAGRVRSCGCLRGGSSGRAVEGRLRARAEREAGRRIAEAAALAAAQARVAARAEARRQRDDAATRAAGR